VVKRRICIGTALSSGSLGSSDFLEPHIGYLDGIVAAFAGDTGTITCA
jgi:hypothetical protein